MKLRFFIILAFLIIGNVTLSAQKNKTEVKVKKSEFKTADRTGLTEAWQNLLIADDLFSQGQGSYSLAREYYLLAHQYNSDNPELNYLIGICYLYTDDKYMAIQFLRKAYEVKPKISPEINYLMGRAYHYALDFDNAIEQYDLFKKSLKPKELVVKEDFINKLMLECKNGKILTSNRSRVIILNLGDSINSEYDDYCSVFAHSDSTLFFTSRRPVSDRSKKNAYDNKFFEDIYVSNLTSGGWSEAKTLSRKINKKSNDAIVGISPDNSQLLIYEGSKKGGEIYTSNIKKGKWNSPQPWISKFSSDESESSVYFTVSGDTVYFISANKKLTTGGRDIMVSTKNSKGKWAKPQNLSSIVNSKYDEEGIYVTPDGRTLYFSSRGHNSMGGYDVFKTERKENGSWSDPENLGYPVNTPDDELFFRLSSNGKTSYLSTIREGGKGLKDIYKLIFLGEEKELLLVNEDVQIAGLPDIKKTGFFKMPDAVAIDSFYYMKGRVLNKANSEPVIAKMDFIDVSASKVVATTISDESGNYMVKLPEPKSYGIQLNAKDYMFFLDVVDMSTATTDEPFMHDFLLDKIEVGTKVVLENIYFETSKATLTAASYPQLNQVVTFLQNNETIRLEISGHTDNVGSLKANLKLSEDRAKAVVDYLVANGIDKLRLEWKGYAFNQPIAPNDTPAGREKNRRVEFKVISK